MLYKQHDRIKITKGSLKGYTGKISASSSEGIYFIQGDWNSQDTGFTNVYGPLMIDEIEPLGHY
ncbi:MULTISPECIES: hypothetical protein [unclassified Coleofasciculus]|uniref:hypothetical protein n=1 Tax=unclassified Coleofasciculus TaxID=2692782 RepID=UPI00187FD52A|nr:MULTISPECIES: hypothetical protein [unclassified Coleofasciculus]MBE9128933.1 hypothetical protein [Coleofasciculus sp. LEGE 07081]MBE9151679.1 hypothetical protein [Coleofasciculus sp. LEGE 07092]